MGVIPYPKMALIFPILCILAPIYPILMKYFPKCEGKGRGKGRFLKSQIKSLECQADDKSRHALARKELRPVDTFYMYPKYWDSTSWFLSIFIQGLF